jgi:PleD family two-component response regulator
MLSNLGQDEEVNKAKKLGANDYMIKAHFTPSDIVKKLREYL